MSSSERGSFLRWPRRLTIRLALLAAALAPAACTVQPLYGPGPTGTAVATTLAGMTIDPVTTRVAQEVRNQLVSYVGEGAQNPTYRMTLSVTSAVGALGVTKVENAPVYSVTVSATYTITSVATGDIVLRDTSRGTASWDRGNQSFANARATIDAENRAAMLAADDIRVRLAAAAARGTI